MYYSKIQYGKLTIEFFNSMSGEETVKVDGEMISEKFSLFGTNHHFQRIEYGKKANYVLTSRISGFSILLDFSRNGEFIVVGQKVGRPPKAKKRLDYRKEGMTFLHEYDLQAAEEKFQNGLKRLPHDSELHFLLACIYSVQEKKQECLEYLKKAIEYGIPDKEKILSHDFLAFIRVQPEFEEFRKKYLN